MIFCNNRVIPFSVSNEELSAESIWVDVRCHQQASYYVNIKPSYSIQPYQSRTDRRRKNARPQNLRDWVSRTRCSSGTVIFKWKTGIRERYRYYISFLILALGYTGWLHRLVTRLNCRFVFIFSFLSNNTTQQFMLEGFSLYEWVSVPKLIFSNKIQILLILKFFLNWRSKIQIHLLRGILKGKQESGTFQEN